MKIAAVLTKFNDNAALYEIYKEHGIEKGVDIIVVLQYNEKLVI